MPDEILLNEAAYAVWQRVYDAGAAGIELGEIVRETGVDQAQVSAAAKEAADKGFFKIDESEREELIPSENARELIDQRTLPEQVAAKHLIQCGQQLGMPEFV